MTPPGWNSLETVKSIHAFFEVSGLALFAALVVFEVLEHRDSSRKKLFGNLALVSFGLAILAEICAYPYSKRNDSLSSAEISNAQKAASEAREDARLAKVRIAAVEQKQEPRSIGPTMEARMIHILQSIPKSKVHFALPNSDNEAVVFGKRLATVFSKSGFEVSGDTQIDFISPGISISDGHSPPSAESMRIMVSMFESCGFEVHNLGNDTRFAGFSIWIGAKH